MDATCDAPPCCRSNCVHHMTFTRMIIRIYVSMASPPLARVVAGVVTASRALWVAQSQQGQQHGCRVPQIAPTPVAASSGLHCVCTGEQPYPTLPSNGSVRDNLMTQQPQAPIPCQHGWQTPHTVLNGKARSGLAPSHSRRTRPSQCRRQRSSTVLMSSPNPPTTTHSFTCAHIRCVQVHAERGTQTTCGSLPSPLRLRSGRGPMPVSFRRTFSRRPSAAAGA